MVENLLNCKPMTHLTNEEKMRYAAGYIGRMCDITWISPVDDYEDAQYALSHELLHYLGLKMIEAPVLHLRDIQSLTDEELIMIAHIRKGNVRGGLGRSAKAEKIRAARETCKFLFDGVDSCWASEIIMVPQYLQSIGVALPFLVIRDNKPVVVSVQEFIEQNVVKIKTA